MRQSAMVVDFASRFCEQRPFSCLSCKRRGGCMKNLASGPNGPRFDLNRFISCNRVAWLLMTGEWPEYEIDHINRDKSDNRWVNLRAVTHAQNARNGPIPRHNKSGFRGVHFASHAKRWRAQIHVGNKTHSLGYFATAEEARAARDQAATHLHGEFAGE